MEGMMEHILRRQTRYFEQFVDAHQFAMGEGALTHERKAPNWFTYTQPLQGHQPRRSKTIHLRCDITKDDGAPSWRVTGWFEDYKADRRV